MNVKAIQMSDLFKVCDDIYTSVMIISQRARQIIDQRVVPIVEDDEVEDSIQFQEPEIKIDDMEKPMVVALKEHLNKELEWRKPTEDNLESNGS